MQQSKRQMYTTEHDIPKYDKSY